MVALTLFGSVIQIGISLPAAFEFAVWKQDHLPLVRVIDYTYQAPINSILGGPLFPSPEPEIKQEEPFNTSRIHPIHHHPHFYLHQ